MKTIIKIYLALRKEKTLKYKIELLRFTAHFIIEYAVNHKTSLINITTNIYLKIKKNPLTQKVYKDWCYYLVENNMNHFKK